MGRKSSATRLRAATLLFLRSLALVPHASTSVSTAHAASLGSAAGESFASGLGGEGQPGRSLLV